MPIDDPECPLPGGSGPTDRFAIVEVLLDPVDVGADRLLDERAEFQVLWLPRVVADEGPQPLDERPRKPERDGDAAVVRGFHTLVYSHAGFITPLVVGVCCAHKVFTLPAAAMAGAAAGDERAAWPAATADGAKSAQSG